MSNESISLLANACGAASGLITVNWIESSSGGSPHHVSLGTSSTNLRRRRRCRPRTDRSYQSLLIGPTHPVLNVSGSATDSAGAICENSAS